MFLGAQALSRSSQKIFSTLIFDIIRGSENSVNDDNVQNYQRKQVSKFLTKASVDAHPSMGVNSE